MNHDSRKKYNLYPKSKLKAISQVTMTSDDSKIDIFIERVFLTSQSSETDEDCFKSEELSALATFKKKMILLFLGLNYMTSEAFFRYFSVVIPIRENVFTIIATHCFDFYEICPEPFLAFLYSAYFIYSMLFNCRYKNLQEFEQFCPSCLKSVFQHRIKEDFYSQGGWQKLLLFSQSDNIPELIDLIRYIYTGKYYFYEFVDSNEWGAFGICSTNVIKVGIQQLDVFESKLQSSFMNSNPENNTNIEESFKKLKNALESKLSLFDTNNNSST